MSVENCEKDSVSDSDGEGEEVIQQGSSHDEKDQNYINHLEKELSRAEEERQKAKVEADNNMNKLRYLMADFDNYRK